MKDLQAILDETVRSGDAPFMVAMVGDKDGVRWSGTAGEAKPGQAASLDTLFRIYSMTKAVGVTAAMILIDRGKLSADTPVEDVMPEAAALKVLEGFDGDTPRLRPPKQKLTLRHLATHTSGMAYEMLNDLTRKYLEVRGHPSIFSGLKTSFGYPLVFDPGEAWHYGPGIDWVGAMVERVDGRSIDAFCGAEIFAPLGMTDTCFELDPARETRLCALYLRGPDGKFIAGDPRNPVKPEFYGMGSCLYSSAPDYMRFIRMHLNGGALDGKRLFSETTARQLQANHIGDVNISVMKSIAPELSADFTFFLGQRKGHSLPFMRVEDDVPGMRSAGSSFWAGGANTHFWIDPTNNIAALFMTQSMPFIERRFVKRYEEFERAVY